MEINGETHDGLHDSINIYMLITEFWVTCPWVLLTVVLIHVITLKVEGNVYAFHLTEHFAIKIDKVSAHSKPTLYIMYIISILLCTITLHKCNIELDYAAAFFSSARYISWAVHIFVFTKIRFIINDHKMDNAQMKANEIPLSDEKEFLEDLDSDCEEENLDGIQFDGYFCYKYVIHLLVFFPLFGPTYQFLLVLTFQISFIAGSFLVVYSQLSSMI